MDLRSLTDPDLVERCLAGERRAWEALVRRHSGLVFGVLRGMGLKREDAEDVMQETFVVLLDKLETVRDRARIGLWLAVTARRRALDRYDRPAHRHEEEMAAGFDAPSRDELPVDALIAAERRERVRRAVAALPPGCRRLLEALYYSGDETRYRDVAARLGVPEGSLGPTRLRCLEKLRRALGEDVPTPRRRSGG